ncbi:amidohydrolase family protein [Duganella sp. FT134W]|uniref:Amidohydrolase family protein n=1 Tax=Duganella margarita TaxID=2692170 RepID=A0A7X4H2J7_9BURK|nr:amidohydrolase family protein [Duganella margarita]MYM73546.1 amidohydrolase family protein [Duganella margarita]
MIVFNAETMRAGAASLRSDAVYKAVLRGDVVSMDPAVGILRRGKVCIAGNTIAHVLTADAAVPPEFDGVVPVETTGTIFPGLVDLHNHLTYNFVPLWSVPRRYTNRNQWRNEQPAYAHDIALPASILAKNPDKDYSRAIVRYAECRSLLGGVTTGQGISASTRDGFRTYFEGLVRNVEHPADADWVACGGQTLDFQPSQIATELVPALARGKPFFYHLSEGTDADARARFQDLQLADGSWAIKSSLICIHCVGLQPADFDQLAAAAGMVWSPTSNFLLYGETARIAEGKRRGIPIALGVDWAPSGCKNMLGELKVARSVSRALGDLFSPEELVSMVSVNPARMIGWEQHIGRIKPGLRADLLVIDGTHEDPYAALIDAREDAIRAVMIDGRLRLGEAGGFAVGTPETSELFMVGRKHYFLDLTEPGNDAMGGMSLATAIAKLDYGLRHLPELAAVPAPAVRGELATRADWTLDLEFDDAVPDALSLLALTPPERVDPMQLDPITAVDDPSFSARLKANPNLPAFLKETL